MALRKQLFDKSKRLCKAAEFKAIRGTRLTVNSGKFFLLAKPNTFSCPRLGLAIAKKHVKLAVQRNRIKRLARESFRQHSDSLPCVDMVLLVRQGIDGSNNRELHQCLESLWQQLIKRVKQFSFS